MVLKKIHLGKEEFERWLGLLVNVNESAKNLESISQYFFSSFSKSPEVFYEFVKVFRTQLGLCEDQKLEKKMANRYLLVLSQLCERFGFFNEKSLLDDLCFKITDDERYKDVDEMMKVYKNNSKSLVNKVLRVFRVFLKEEGYECEVKGRYKNLYSINKKLRKKMKKSAIKLNDIFAFRIVLESNSVDECFEVLNLFHDRFYPVVDYFKDYVTIPKINGYQSLHTGLIEVVEKLDIPIEVQIRTRAMDDFAEKGFAAHWLYAKGKKSKMVTEKEKKLVEHFSDLSQGDEELKDVYVFTPKGDLFKLENGSTIVDFAYHLHSDLGHKARSAIVNGGKQDIYYRLMSGDCVEIKKSEKDCVKREWLDHVHSKHTRKKIYEKIGRQ